MAATFFMVSGGTYGTEEIVSGAGYGHGILILLFLPVLWCLPTAFMIGELSSSLPAEGGYYAWVRRGLGNFWGFQEAWLSLAASIFDMAIYPSTFRLLFEANGALVRRRESRGAGRTVCRRHLRRAEHGRDPRCWHHFALAVLRALRALRHHRGDVSAARQRLRRWQRTRHRNRAGIGLLGGVLVAMWNYMGWTTPPPSLKK